MTVHLSSHTELWHEFALMHALTDKQLLQFQTYYELLVEWNDNFNLTRITELRSVLGDHFSDSLALSLVVDMNKAQALIDVGTGAGFPGIPLKIKYPHISIVLVEVTHKKREFLAEVIARLGLKDIEISDLDWRNFLRQTSYPCDVVCARASLQPEELLRVFKPASPYNKATLVYWAAQDWHPLPLEQKNLIEQKPYTVRHKKRQLIVWRAECS